MIKINHIVTKVIRSKVALSRGHLYTGIVKASTYKLKIYTR